MQQSLTADDVDKGSTQASIRSLELSRFFGLLDPMRLK